VVVAVVARHGNSFFVIYIKFLGALLGLNALPWDGTPSCPTLCLLPQCEPHSHHESKTMRKQCHSAARI